MTGVSIALERNPAVEPFQRIVEALGVGILIADERGQIVFSNAQLESLFGYPKQELVGQPVEVLVPQRSRDQHPGHVAGFCADPHPRLMGKGRDLYGLRKDGTEIPVEIGLLPIETPEGLRVVASVIEITERKRVQEQQALLNRQLETLLHVVSHDLKEPLRAIESFSAFLHDQYADRLDQKGRDFAQRIVKAAKRLRLLLDDVLSLSRARLVGLSTAPVDSRLIVDRALEQLAAKIEDTRATIRVARDLPRLRADMMWSTQAVYNLVANALKFTRDGAAPEVEIAAYHPPPRDPRGVGLVVRDRGPGVAPEHRERIFELFQRAVGREVEGTGAGLAIVAEIAKRHGGSAWVQPRPGGGSEFVITFGAS